MSFFGWGGGGKGGGKSGKGGGYGRGGGTGGGRGGRGGDSQPMAAADPAEVADFDAAWASATPLDEGHAGAWNGLGAALVGSAALSVVEKAPVLCANGETLYNRVEVRATATELLFMCNGVPDYAPRKINGGKVVESDWQGRCRSGRIDRNPNKIIAQDYRFRVPVAPGAPLATPITATPMGPIGIALNGVPLFHGDMQYTNPKLPNGLFANQDESFDQCCGHPDGRGMYHYHQYPRCVVGASALGLDAPDALVAALKDDADLTAAPLAKALTEQIAKGEPSKCIGIAFDGIPIMGHVGIFDGEVRLARSSYVGELDTAKGNPVYVEGHGDLDACNGCTGADGVWRYYATIRIEGDDVVPVFPYMIGAYRCQPVITNFPNHQRAKVTLG